MQAQANVHPASDEPEQKIVAWHIAAFTPGPWVVEIPSDARKPLLIKTERPLYEGAITGVEITRLNRVPHHRANAALIAAAPELLEALQVLYENVDDYQRINNLSGHDNQDMRMARAAIAKATGG